MSARLSNYTYCNPLGRLLSKWLTKCETPFPPHSVHQNIISSYSTAKLTQLVVVFQQYILKYMKFTINLHESVLEVLIGIV